MKSREQERSTLYRRTLSDPRFASKMVAMRILAVLSYGVVASEFKGGSALYAALYCIPVSSQSTLTLNFRFNRSKTSAVGNISPLSYFESWLWLIPSCSANAACVNQIHALCLSRLPMSIVRETTRFAKD